MTTLEAWRSSLDGMSLDELDELVTDDERGAWLRAIADRPPDDGRALTERDLAELLAQVLAATSAGQVSARAVALPGVDARP